jgi:peroxiredoxin
MSKRKGKKPTVRLPPWGWLAVSLAVAALAVLVGVHFLGGRARSCTQVGCRAPDFTLPGLTGNPVSLRQFRGKVVLLFFWESTCPDCRRALPRLWELRDRYQGRGLVLVGVNVDVKKEFAERYLKEQGYTDLLVLRGTFEQAMDVVKLFGVELVPHVFIIDRQGVIRFSGTWPVFPTQEEIERWL